MKQVWVSFGVRSRPVDTWRAQEGEFEGMARGMMGVPVDVEFYIGVEGRSMGWN